MPRAYLPASQGQNASRCPAGSCAHRQPFNVRCPFDRLEDLACQFVLLGQATGSSTSSPRRARTRGSGRYRTDPQLAWLPWIASSMPSLDRPKALLGYIHAQHARQSCWIASFANDRGIKRVDQLMRLRPSRHLVSARSDRAPANFCLAEYSRSEKLFWMALGMRWTCRFLPPQITPAPRNGRRRNRSAVP